MTVPWPLPGMSLPLSLTASAFGARMRNVTFRSAVTSGETTWGPWGAPNRGVSVLVCASNGDTRIEAIVTAVAVRIAFGLFIAFIPLFRVDLPAAGGAIASVMRPRNSTSVFASSGRNAARSRPRNGSVSTMSLLRTCAPLRVTVTLRARPSVGCPSRATRPRFSKRISMARTVFGSEEARRTSSCWVTPSWCARRLSRTN